MANEEVEKGKKGTKVNNQFIFRVWYNNSFHHDCYINDGMVYVLRKASDERKFPCVTLVTVGYDFAIQQFTGIKDIHNKEIFLGDIVQLEYANQQCGFGRYEVIFERGAYHLKTIEKNWLRDDHQNTQLGSYRICNIIGNIFENPELIKVKK